MVRRIIHVALRNLWLQPLRTLLVLQGVIWGTALGIAPPAIINGSLQLVEEDATRLGTDRLLLTQEHAGAPRPFDWALVDSLRQEHRALIRHATGMQVMEAAGPVILTDDRALEARGLRLAEGRFFSARELAEGAAVCVLEHHAARERFGGASPLGRTLELPGLGALRVIGVTAPREDAARGLDELGYQRDHPMQRLVEQMKQYVGVFQDPEVQELREDRAVLVPFTRVSGSRPVWIEFRADPREVLGLRDRLQNRLAADGYEPVIYVNAILPVLYGETIKTAIELNRAVFFLCIVVGASVVSSIMVLSVVERQREIAIRRVEGARRWHIALQFVVETGTLCGVGAVLGVPLGLLLAMARCALEPLGSVTWTLPVYESFLLVLIVTGVGLGAGLLPAWRAMRVHPVEMLRYE